MGLNKSKYTSLISCFSRFNQVLIMLINAQKTLVTMLQWLFFSMSGGKSFFASVTPLRELKVSLHGRLLVAVEN